MYLRGSQVAISANPSLNPTVGISVQPNTISLGDINTKYLVADTDIVKYGRFGQQSEIATLADIPSVTDFLEVDGSNADAKFTVNGVKLAGNYVYIDGVSYGGINATQTNSNIYYQLGVDSHRAFLSMPSLTLNSYPAIGSGGMYSPADTIMNVNSDMRISFNNGKKFYYGSSNTANNEVAIKGDIPTTMTGADGTNAGTSGLVPAPSATDNTKFLKGDGTWADVNSGTTYTAGTGIDITNDTISIDNTVALKSEIPTNADYVDLTTAQDISGRKYFSNALGVGYNGINNFGGYQLYIRRNPNSSALTATNALKATNSNKNIDVGTSYTTTNILGSGTRPTYNSNDLALLSDIPTVNNSTITFTQGGITKGSITLNQSSDATIALDAGSSPDNPLEPLTDKEGLANVTSLAHSSFDSGNFTIVGTPTITDNGIAGGFSSSNYLTKDLNLSGDSLKIRAELMVNSNTKTQVLLYNTNFQLRLLYVSGSGLLFPSLYVSDGTHTAQPRTSTYGLQTYTNYIIEIEYKHNVSASIKLYSEDGTLLDSFYSTGSGATSAVIPDATLTTNIGKNAGSDYIDGTVDLKQLSIQVDNIPIFSGNKTGTDTYTISGSTVTIPYTLSKTGSKIVDSAYRTDIETVYNNQGYVRYYTLNEGVNYTLPTPPDKGYLPNLSWVLNNMNSTPDYSASITMDLGNSNFTAPTKGIMVLAGYTTGGDNIGGILRISINSNVVYTNATNPTGYTYFDLCLPVDSGDVINLLTITTPATINTQKFFPLKEVN